MKLLCISDTHGQHNTFTDQITAIDADVLIHAGDVTNFGTDRELIDFVNWLGSFKHIPHKLFVGGNHDESLERITRDAREGENFDVYAKKLGVKFLHHEQLEIDGLLFYGSSYSPEFMDWHFMYRRGEPARALWDMIPQNTDVLITHTPPLDILDEVIGFGGGHVGCKDLLDRVNLLNPSAHVFGHIHNGYGCAISQYGQTTFVNASLLNEQYQPVNKPIFIVI